MKTVTYDSIRSNLGNSKKINNFIENSFENSDIESLFPSNDNLPNCFTWLSEPVFCPE